MPVKCVWWATTSRPKIYPIAQALKIAEEQGLDLIEISPTAEPLGM